jgi:hypothetical protein
MTDQLQRDLRAAFDRLTAEPTPLAGALTAHARRRAARTRAVQLTTTTAAVIAIVAGGVVTVRTVTAPTVVTPLSTTTAASTGQHPSPAPPRRVVTAYSTPGRADQHDRPLPPVSLVRNPQTGQLQSLPYDSVTPSPDGRRAIVVKDFLHPAIGVLDLPAGRPRWIEGYDGTASWSPDGRRILITGGPQVGLSQQDKTLPRNNGFAIVDATSLHVTFTPIADVPNSFGASGVWLPDNQHIAISVGENGVPTGIRIYDLAGNAVRTLPATALLTSEAAISPDGARFALVDAPDHHIGQLTVVNASTGAVESRSTALRSAALVGWYDNTHLVIHEWSQRGAANDALAVIDHTGHLVRRISLPPGPNNGGWTVIHLGTGTTGGF